MILSSGTLQGSSRDPGTPRDTPGTPQGPPGTPPGRPGIARGPPRDAQGTPKGAQGVPKNAPWAPTMPAKCPQVIPRAPTAPSKLAPETSQRPWDTFQGHIFDSKSGTNGSVTEKSYLSEAMAYLHVYGNRCPPEHRSRGRRCVAVGVLR